MTGVLPIALGRATRIAQTLLKAGKEYVGVMHLHKEISENDLIKGVSKFKGVIEQLPPVRSAVKRQLRKREIYYFDILEIDGKDVLFRVGCEAGTYIRKLIYDLGKELKINAHMAQLIRTKVGYFNDSNYCTLQDLSDSYSIWKNEGDENLLRKIIFPIEKGVEHLPKIWIMDNAVDTLCHGANLNVPAIIKLNNVKENDLVAVMSLKDELICLGLCQMDKDEIMKKEKGFAVKTKKVFMERGTYKLK